MPMPYNDPLYAPPEPDESVVTEDTGTVTEIPSDDGEVESDTNSTDGGDEIEEDSAVSN